MRESLPTRQAVQDGPRESADEQAGLDTDTYRFRIRLRCQQEDLLYYLRWTGYQLVAGERHCRSARIARIYSARPACSSTLPTRHAFNVKYRVPVCSELRQSQACFYGNGSASTKAAYAVHWPSLWAFSEGAWMPWAIVRHSLYSLAFKSTGGGDLRLPLVTLTPYCATITAVTRPPFRVTGQTIALCRHAQSRSSNINRGVSCREATKQLSKLDGNYSTVAPLP